MAKKSEELAAGFALPQPPKRTQVAERTARQFERGGSKMRRAVRGERVSGYIPPSMAEALKVRCVRERRSVSDAMTEALDVWLKGS